MVNDRAGEAVFQALDKLKIEIPSCGFANTGTRFGKFIQLAAATCIEEKFSDAAEVNRLTGACPTLALHVEWDLPNGLRDISKVQKLGEKYNIRPGSINPNVFQDQEYKYGSLRPLVREWRQARGLPQDPLQAFTESGYLERATKERRERNVGAVASYA